MRVGLAVSIIGHAAILGVGFIAFPEARPFAPEQIEALPVELIDVAEVTDLKLGDEKAEELPQEKEQPKSELKAETPAPESAEKPAEKVVEGAREPPSPAPQPRDPEPEPEAALEPDEIAALIPEASLPPASEVDIVREAVEEPEPSAPPANPNLPRVRPKPLPKPVAEPKPEPEPEPAPTVAQPQQPDPEFNPDDIAALLNKQEPAGGGDPQPSPEPQTIGSIAGQAEAVMTQSEIAALKARLYQCWNPPIGVREAGGLVVQVQITLLPDGSLAGEPVVRGIQMASSPLAQIAAEAAVRAVVQCAPFGDILRPETYASWSHINFNFDPRLMLGG
jgi:hypothetical protein